MRYVWDTQKNLKNIKKHEVSFIQMEAVHYGNS